MSKTYRLGRFRRAMNALVTPMLRLGIGARSAHLLTTTGARTGLARTTPVTLRRGRVVQQLHAHELGPQAAGPVLQGYLRQEPVTAAFFDARATDDVATLVAEASRHPVFALT